MRSSVLACWIAVGCLSCSDDSATPGTGGNAPDGGAGGSVQDGGPIEDADPPGDADASEDASLPAEYEAVRSIIHAHSIYSHDGCTGDGYPYGSPESLACLAEMRAAPCTLGIDLLALTDHPDNMRDQEFTDDLHYDLGAGDELIMNDGDPIANRVTCPNGHRYLITAGYEDQHSMPLGLHRHLAEPDDYDGITDATPLATVQARVAAMEAAGAVPALVHSEMDNISVPTIRDGGFAAMEWYNIHANIEILLGGHEYLISGDYQQVISSLGAIDAFLLGSGSGAHPDLVYLAMLPFAPMAGYDKWSEITRSRAITGLLGTDVHRNVAVDVGICAGVILPLCQVAAALFPNVLTLLITGGTIQLTDNEQLDSYRRVMSWLENRILVEEITPLAISDALRAGRSYGLFSVFGEPDALAFTVDSGSGSLPMGSVVSGGGTIHVELPTRPVAMDGYVPFSQAEAELAEIRAELVHTHAGGRNVVHESTTSFDYEATAAGAYHLEIHIRPLHLVPHLGSEGVLAQPEMLWVLTNPVRVEF